MQKNLEQEGFREKRKEVFPGSWRTFTWLVVDLKRVSVKVGFYVALVSAGTRA